MKKSKNYKEYEAELIATYNKAKELRECGNADHLCDENGEFISANPHDDGHVSIGYLEDICQWLFYHNNIEFEEKLDKIQRIERMIEKYLNGIHYIPYWSAKLNVTKDEK